MMARLLGGVVLAASVARLAAHRGHLAPSGERAAIGVGTCAVAAGWAWGALLIAYFLSSSALTALGRSRKITRTSETVAPAHRRTARPVMANGGLFAACALLGTFGDAPMLRVAAVGALAAAAADTWATEIGTLWGGTPRSIVTWRPISTGLSGGVTPAGLTASAGAALAVAASTPWLLPTPDAERLLPAVALAGLAGSLVDSVLGAVGQVRHRCATCGLATERTDHCGGPTHHAAGWRWMTNDAVNLLSTVAGALVAVTLAPPAP